MSEEYKVIREGADYTEFLTHNGGWTIDRESAVIFHTKGKANKAISQYGGELLPIVNYLTR